MYTIVFNSLIIITFAVEKYVKLRTYYVIWLFVFFWLNGPLRQYFSLYLAVSQRVGERKEK